MRFEKSPLGNSLFLCLFAALLRARIANSCSPCQCAGKEADCSNLGLTEVPHIPNALTFTSLLLDNNNISDFSNLTYFERLKSLSMRDNNLSMLNSDHMPKSLRILDVSGNELMYVNLTGLDSLQNLAVDLVKLHEKPFDGLIQLQNLNVRLISTTIMETIFDGCCEDLGFLKINLPIASEMPTSLMCQNWRLTNLFVVGNKMLSLPGDFLNPNCSNGQKQVTVENLTIMTFDELASGLITGTTIELDVLKIQDVNSIPDDLLHRKYALNTLDISYSNLTSFRKEWLRDIKHIEVVNFSHNAIDALYQGMIGSQIKKLDKLDLSYNEIASVPEGSLQVLKNGIAYLDLSHNPIKHLSEFVFAELTALETVVLSHAEFESMPLLQPRLDIKKLYLQNNRITHFPEKLNLEALEHLELQNNYLKWLPIELSSLVHLKHLDVHNNSISCLLSGTFSELDQLEYLDLSWNNLRFLPDNAFHSLESLKYLNLSHNDLQVVSLDAFLQCFILVNLNFAFNNITKISRNESLLTDNEIDIDMRNNSFLCNCHEVANVSVNVIHCPDIAPDCTEFPVVNQQHDECVLPSTSGSATMESIFTTQNLATSKVTDRENGTSDKSTAMSKMTTSGPTLLPPNVPVKVEVDPHGPEKELSTTDGPQETTRGTSAEVLLNLNITPTSGIGLLPESSTLKTTELSSAMPGFLKKRYDTSATKPPTYMATQNSSIKAKVVNTTELSTTESDFPMERTDGTVSLPRLYLSTNSVAGQEVLTTKTKTAHTSHFNVSLTTTSVSVQEGATAGENTVNSTELSNAKLGQEIQVDDSSRSSSLPTLSLTTVTISRQEGATTTSERTASTTELGKGTEERVVSTTGSTSPPKPNFTTAAISEQEGTTTRVNDISTIELGKAKDGRVVETPGSASPPELSFSTATLSEQEGAANSERTVSTTELSNAEEVGVLQFLGSVSPPKLHFKTAAVSEREGATTSESTLATTALSNAKEVRVLQSSESTSPPKLSFTTPTVSKQEGATMSADTVSTSEFSKDKPDREERVYESSGTSPFPNWSLTTVAVAEQESASSGFKSLPNQGKTTVAGSVFLPSLSVTTAANSEQEVASTRVSTVSAIELKAKPTKVESVHESSRSSTLPKRSLTTVAITEQDGVTSVGTVSITELKAKPNREERVYESSESSSIGNGSLTSVATSGLEGATTLASTVDTHKLGTAKPGFLEEGFEYSSRTVSPSKHDVTETSTTELMSSRTISGTSADNSSSGVPSSVSSEDPIDVKKPKGVARPETTPSGKDYESEKGKFKEISDEPGTTKNVVSTNTTFSMDEETHNVELHPTCIPLSSNFSGNISLYCSLLTAKRNMNVYSNKSVKVAVLVCSVVFMLLAVISFWIFIAHLKRLLNIKQYYKHSKSEYV